MAKSEKVKKQRKAKYEKGLDLYRKDHSLVDIAKTLKLDRNTVIRYRDVGLIRQDLPPWKDVLETEKLKAAAMVTSIRNAPDLDEIKVLEGAASQKITSMAQEQMILTNLRSSIIESTHQANSIMKTVTRLMESIEKTAEKLLAQLEREDAKAEAEEKDLDFGTYHKRLNYLMNLSEAGTRMLERLGHVTQSTLQAERLHLGEPTDILGHKKVDNLTPQEAEHRARLIMESLSRLARSAKRRREYVEGKGFSTVDPILIGDNDS